MRISSLDRDTAPERGGGDGGDPQTFADGVALLLGCDCRECGWGESDLFAEETPGS
jgi:hypothetical protein